MKVTIVVFFNLYLCIKFISIYCEISYSQEGAKIPYYNPNYIINPSINTGRSGRGAPYVTNVTFTILHAWGNNLTLLVILNTLKGTPISFSYKLCDAVKIDWIKNMISKITVNKLDCPFPPDTYYFVNFDLPNNIPLILSESYYECSVSAHLTKSKLKLMEITGKLKANRQAPIARKKIKTNN